MEIIARHGSVQSIPGLPDDLKQLYKTVWEIQQKVVIEMAADRAPFIDQSQSLNIHIAEPSMAMAITSMHFCCWKLGLKTGMYYLRTKPAANAIQFTVDKTKLMATTSGAKEREKSGESGDAPSGGPKPSEEEVLMCSLLNKDESLMCGS